MSDKIVPMKELPSDEMKHTKEPWFKHEKIVSHVFGSNNRSVANCAGVTSNISDEESVNDANANRIVECVNALVGIENPAKFIQSQQSTITTLEKEVERLKGALQKAISNKYLPEKQWCDECQEYTFRNHDGSCDGHF